MVAIFWGDIRTSKEIIWIVLLYFLTGWNKSICVICGHERDFVISIRSPYILFVLQIRKLDTSLQQNSTKMGKFLRKMKQKTRFVYKVQRCLGNPKLNSKSYSSVNFTHLVRLPLVWDQNELSRTGKQVSWFYATYETSFP